MNSRKTKGEIEFLSSRKARFHFECKACGRCCGQYQIVLSPYDIIRLRRATDTPTTELRRRKIIRIRRVPSKKVFGFGPVADMLDMFGISPSDTVPVAFLGLKTEESGKRVCLFLSPPKRGKRLCTIYEHRPGMCRLHPLGCVTIANRRKWIYRQPLCDSNDAPEQTVEAWLQSSCIRPFLASNARYFQWIRELFGQRKNLSHISGTQWEALAKILYDFDSIGPCTERINMDTIDKMFHEWLSQIEPSKRRGG